MRAFLKFARILPRQIRRAWHSAQSEISEAELAEARHRAVDSIFRAKRPQTLDAIDRQRIAAIEGKLAFALAKIQEMEEARFGERDAA